MNRDIAAAKRAARVLREALAEDGSTGMTHSRALEIVARQWGYPDWNTASAALGGTSAHEFGLGTPVPVLRVQDALLMRRFYVDYLGFAVDWEHRFESSMPLYLRVHRERFAVDLSEHHGDGVPGTVVWVAVADLRGLHRQLSAKDYSGMRPGIDEHAPGGPTMEVVDPFGNVIRCCQETG